MISPAHPSSPPTWREAQSRGRAAEENVADFLRTLGLYAAPPPDGYCPQYDLAIHGTCEVKDTPRAEASGLVFVETSHNARASGLSESTASCWAFVLPGGIIFIRTNQLRELARTAREKAIRFADGNVKGGRLIRLLDLRQRGFEVFFAGGDAP